MAASGLEGGGGLRPSLPRHLLLPRLLPRLLLHNCQPLPAAPASLEAARVVRLGVPVPDIPADHPAATSLATRICSEAAAGGLSLGSDCAEVEVNVGIHG